LTPKIGLRVTEAKVCVGKTWTPFASEKRFQFLAYLAYQGDWVSRERLAYVFWSDLSDEVARRNLRKVVHKLPWPPRLHSLNRASRSQSRHRSVVYAISIKPYACASLRCGR
jgi:hypothetical protein